MFIFRRAREPGEFDVLLDEYPVTGLIGGALALEEEELSISQVFTQSGAGTSSNSGALVTALNSLSQDVAGTTNNAGELTTISVGQNDMVGVSANAGALVVDQLSFSSEDCAGESPSSGELFIQIGITLTGQSNNSGLLRLPDERVDCEGSSTNSGAITGNVKIESAFGFEIQQVPVFIAIDII